MSAIFDRTYSFRSTSAVVHCAKKLERPDRVDFRRSAYRRLPHGSGRSCRTHGQLFDRNRVVYPSNESSTQRIYIRGAQGLSGQPRFLNPRSRGLGPPGLA